MLDEFYRAYAHNSSNLRESGVLLSVVMRFIVVGIIKLMN
jgi:hypothetical protein